jgi:hypothetical protein
MIALQETGQDASVASGKQVLAKLKKVAEEVLEIKPKAKQEEPPPDERRPGRITRREWNGGGTAIPTQRSGANEPRGYERAVKNAEARARAIGAATSPSVAATDAAIIATFPKGR